MIKQIIIDLPFNCHVMLTGEGESAKITSNLYHGKENLELAAAMDAVESLVLAQYCAGVDVTTSAYAQALATTIESCENALGD